MTFLVQQFWERAVNIDPKSLFSWNNANKLVADFEQCLGIDEEKISLISEI
jgi:hypothetical protein